MDFLMLRSKCKPVRVDDVGGDDNDGVVEQEYSHDGGDPTHLTVWRKSQIFNCNGFTVIDSSSGNIVYRVDNYMGDEGKEILLMDGSGKALLTMRRQKLSLVANWHIYEGDVNDDECCRLQKLPICKVRRHMNLLHTNQNVLAHMVLRVGGKRYTYVIEGSYRKRSCKVLDESRTVLAEIMRKEEMIRGISFGVEVFVLIVQSGFDHGIAMAIVSVLDQMFS